jgi:hypothetical protein
LRGVSVVATGPSEGKLAKGLERGVIIDIFARLGRSLPNCWLTLRSRAGLSVLPVLGFPRRRM